MRITDIAEAITSGRFKGRTMAVRFHAQQSGFPSVDPATAPTMRGDIEPTATISGTRASNAIAGTISNMEDWDSKGYWEDSAIIPDDISLGTNGMIGAKGEFTETLANCPAGYDNGGCRGNFYGPHDSLEAAGTWVMAPPTADSKNKWGIAGSFGAAMVREDGTCGREVPAID